MGQEVDLPNLLSSPRPDTGRDLALCLNQKPHPLAVEKMRFERENHTLRPIALVNEACILLVSCSDRGRVLRIAANVMHHILVNYARAHRAGKRGDAQAELTLFEDFVEGTNNSTEDILSIDVALNRLNDFDLRQATIREMHFLGGLTIEEVELQLSVSTRTVKRDWVITRDWLSHELSARQYDS